MEKALPRFQFHLEITCLKQLKALLIKQVPFHFYNNIFHIHFYQKREIKNSVENESVFRVVVWFKSMLHEVMIQSGGEHQIDDWPVYN